MSRSTRPHPLARRSAAALLAVGLSILTACSEDDGGGDDSTAAATSAAAQESSSSPPATSAPATGSPTDGPAETETETETIRATEGEMFIELDEDSFAAGSYTIEVANDGSASHDLVVERDGADVAATEMIAPGATATLTVDLEPGEYVFYCSVGNHRAMGMEVTVTVT